MTVKFLADENFNNDLLIRLRSHVPGCDVVRAQDVGLLSTPDPDVLEWAAVHDRIVLTHDVSTMIRFAYDRVRLSKPMPGVIVINSLDFSAQLVSDLVIAAECGRPDDFRDLVKYIPF